VVGTSITDGM